MPEYRKGSLVIKKAEGGWIIVEKKTQVRVPGSALFPVGQLDAARASLKKMEKG